eukprot:gene15993-7326_t
MTSPSPEIKAANLLSAKSSADRIPSTSSPVLRPLTPVQAKMVFKAAKHWRNQHETIINNKITNLRNAKRNRDLKAENEINEIVARRVPFDILAKEWLDVANVSIEQRSYLLDKLIPTLVLGVEKLLTVAEKKGLIDTEEPVKDFNPINYLAQYLMRNNPRYSNFAEASPYARGIRKLLDDLKKEAYNQEENKLAKMKMEAKRRKDERERMEKLNLTIVKGRNEALHELFLQWVEDKNGVIFLHLYVSGQTSDFAEDIFAEFLKHMGHLATEYKMSAQMESIRLILANLFISCDHGDTGLLDRKRVLKLLETFYDNSKNPTIKSTLRNPRQWPVIDFDEQDENIDDIIEEEDLAVEDSAFEEQGKEATSLKQGEVNENDYKENENGGTVVGISESKESENGGTVIEGSESKEKYKEKTMVASNESKENDNGSAVVDGSDTKIGDNANSEKEVKGNNANEAVSDQDNVQETKGVKASKSTDAVKVSEKMEQEIREIIDGNSTAMGSSESPVKSSRAQSVATGSIFDPTTLNQAQFINLLEKFLGELSSRTAIETLVRYVRAGYIETEEERMARLEKARVEARSAKRRHLIDQLFDLWDVDGSGYLEMTEIEMVLSKWREDGMKMFPQASDVFEEAYGRISRKMFKRYIEQITKMFPDEDCFDSLIAFLFASVERSFEERKRGDFRKKWLLAVENSARMSGAMLEPVFKTIYLALYKDAEVHGRNKKIAAHVAFVEPNDPAKSNRAGVNCLKYVSCTTEDVPYVLDKTLYRDMKCVSFTVVDSGKPIHVPRVLHNGGVHMWNSARKEEGIEGSLVMLPLKDNEKRVTGVMGIDTLPDPHEKSVFVTHEISFYQGLAKGLSSAIQFIDSRRKTIKIAESAVSWILRRSQNVKEVNIYLVEPGTKASDGLVLRKMATLRQNHNDTKYESPPRLERKDNLFRDYLFKCIDTSETLTADAYGERHTAFPLRDAEGMAVAIVDISIGDQKQLPLHESKEIHRMLKLLAMAHKEVSREIAGEEKNIVLEVEKEHQEKRIDVLFDRIMLQDLRDNVGRLDARAFAEIKSYKDPPKLVHDIVKAVLEIYFGGKEDDEMADKLEEWTTCKQLVNADLVSWISTFDPTASSNLALDGEKLATNLSNVPPGAVAKHGSLPAQYLFNWAFVCLSLIEHTSKMRENRPVQGSQTDQKEDTDAKNTVAEN